MADELVSLCECWDLLEAQAIRASFEARGVFVHVDGEHHRSMIGTVSAVALRIMVRSSQLDLARELAAEIIPELARPDEGDDEQLGAGHSPLRRPPPEDLVAYRDDDDDEADEEDDDEPTRPPKRIAVALVVLGLGLAIGTIHFYAERPAQGLGLLAVAGFAFLALVGGQSWALPLLGLVWFVDAVHGIHLLRRHNREIAEQAKPKLLLN